MKNKIKAFQTLVQAGIDAWTQAGELLVEMLDKDPDIKEKIVEECAGITCAHLAKFEAIGRGVLDPRLLLNGSEGYTRLQRAPLSDQRKALDEGLEVYEPSPSGEPTHRRVKPENINRFEASQIFAPGGTVRTVQEQQAYLAKREVRTASKASNKLSDKADYVIRGRKVIFKNDCIIGAGDLARILAELTK